MPMQKKALTLQELSSVDQQLSSEELFVKKYLDCINQLSNPELVNLCYQLATRHQQNFNSLYHALAQHTIQKQTTSQQQEWQLIQQQALQANQTIIQQ